MEKEVRRVYTHATSISYLRIFATVCVIFLHTCSTLTDNQSVFALNNGQRLFFEIMHQIMAWAVPAFFMITGTLFLRKETNNGVYDYIFKYSKKILLALLCFGIPYSILKFASSGKLGKDVFGRSILAIITDESFGHLWYLYVLIGIYLIMPILKRFTDNASEQEIKFILFTIFLLDFVFPCISELIDIEIAFKSQVLYPIFYVLLGHWLYNNRNRYSKKKSVFLMLFVIIVICVINLMDWNCSIWTRYDSPLIAILASTIFILFVTKYWRNFGCLWSIDRLCFGAYLIHPLFIQFTYRFLNITPLVTNLYPIMTIVLFFIFVFLSFLSSWMLRKNKIIKKYIL